MNRLCLPVAVNFNCAELSHIFGAQNFHPLTILKFEDIIRLEQMKIIFEFKIYCLPIDLTNLFHENKDISSQVTRNVSKGGIFFP